METESKPLYISDCEVKKLLSWSMVFEACEQALRSVCKIKVSESQPTALQPTRPTIAMQRRAGLVFSMLAYIDNYELPSIAPNTKFDTLGHKLVTVFNNNQHLETPLPNVLATITLFDPSTGRLQAIIEGTEITAWRTAAASFVSTKYLYFNRVENRVDKVLAVVGCGVQGRVHAIGMCTLFSISEVHLWNRTDSKAHTLSTELNDMKSTFINPNVKIVVHQTVGECVKTADIIAMVTSVTTPLLFASMLKETVHVNAVGVGLSHHSEVEGAIYEKSKIYVDSLLSAETELKTLNYPIEGEVGEVINGLKETPKHSLTLFQSMGIAVEDATVAQLILELYKKQSNI